MERDKRHGCTPKGWRRPALASPQSPSVDLCTSFPVSKRVVVPSDKNQVSCYFYQLSSLNSLCLDTNTSVRISKIVRINSYILWKGCWFKIWVNLCMLRDQKRTTASGLFLVFCFLLQAPILVPVVGWAALWSHPAWQFPALRIAQRCSPWNLLEGLFSISLGNQL